MIYLVGTDKARCASATRVRSLAEARREAATRGFIYWAAYRETRGFHSTAQREHLLAHHADPFWINSGVPSTE